MDGSILEKLLPLIPHMQCLLLDVFWDIDIVAANQIFGALPALCPDMKSFSAPIPLYIASLSHWPAEISLPALQRLRTKHYLAQEVLASERRDANYGRFFSQIKRTIQSRLPSLRYWIIAPEVMNPVEEWFINDLKLALFRQFGPYHPDEGVYQGALNRMIDRTKSYLDESETSTLSHKFELQRYEGYPVEYGQPF